MTREQQIFEVAKAGDAARVKALLEADPRLIDARDEDGYPPLYWAALHGFNRRSLRSQPVVDLLLAWGAAVDIFAAAYLSRPQRAAELLTNDPGLAGARDGAGMTPLHHAAERGATEVARLLIEYGADVNARDAHSQTPLHYACHPGPWKPAAAHDTIELLRAHGAELDLFLAASLGDTERLAALLAQEPGLVHTRDESASTPLFHAARHLHRAAVALLLAAGADVNARRDDGRTAVSTAIGRMDDEGGPEVVQLLIDHGAELDLFDACAVGRADRVAALLIADPSLAQTRKWGQTPRQIATRHGHLAIVELLVKAGAE